MDSNHSIIIIGAGMVGLTQAIALADQGIKVTIIDRQDPDQTLGESFDGRVSAIAWRSQKLLAKIGVWEKIAPFAEPILDIRVSEFGSGLFLHFDHNEITKDMAEPFGYIVENRYIRKALIERAKELAQINLIAPAEITEIDVKNSVIKTTNPKLAIANYTLLIAADGKNSIARKLAGITTFQKSYRQTAIVTTIAHSTPHQGLAHEHFLNVGPFAVLPMQNNRSSLVWCEPTELAPLYMGMADAEFLAQIQKRIKYLGEISLTGPRWSYPLELVHADKYFAGNIVLIGDAAHSIHPIAGQGVNLGFRDVETLSDLIYEDLKLGLTPSSATLNTYQSIRRLDNAAMITATDRLNGLFSNQILPLKLARTIGLSAVNQIPVLKKAFMRYASGRF